MTNFWNCFIPVYFLGINLVELAVELLISTDFINLVLAVFFADLKKWFDKCLYCFSSFSHRSKILSINSISGVAAICSISLFRNGSLLSSHALRSIYRKGSVVLLTSNVSKFTLDYPPSGKFFEQPPSNLLSIFIILMRIKWKFRF